MEFLKLNELSLNPAKYLVSTVTNKPVNNRNFYNQQKDAEMIIKLSEKIKDKNFKQVEVDCIESIKKEVIEELNSTKLIEYRKVPEAPKSKTLDELVNYALNFNKFEDEKSKIEEINKTMNNYNTIYDVENAGEYFHEDIVKLNKIYTISEILEAVTLISNKLN